MGNFLSHVRLLQRAVYEARSVAVIMEDDIELVPDFAAKASPALCPFPRDAFSRLRQRRQGVLSQGLIPSPVASSSPHVASLSRPRQLRAALSGLPRSWDMMYLNTCERESSAPTTNGGRTRLASGCGESSPACGPG